MHLRDSLMCVLLLFGEALVNPLTDPMEQKKDCYNQELPAKRKTGATVKLVCAITSSV